VKEPQWLLRETILALQDQLIAEFGGLKGLRDDVMLDSALARPQQSFHYGKQSLFDLAALYASGLVSNHPFVDGNKRIGFTSAILFLELNGAHFSALEADATIQTLALAVGALDKTDYAAWLKTHSLVS
jgi:death on curing protein